VATFEQLLDAHQLAHAHPSGSSADIIAGQILPFAPEPDGLGSATKEKAMKFEMITQDDLFTFKPLDDAAAAWMRKSPYADGGSAFITKKLYLRDSVLKAIKEAGGSVVQVPTN